MRLLLPQIAAPEAGELDLAVVFATPPVTAGEVLRVEPTVWVTSRAHGLHLQRPLPIAAYFRSDWCSTYMLTSLERMGIDYRIALNATRSAGFGARCARAWPSLRFRAARCRRTAGN